MKTIRETIDSPLTDGIFFNLASSGEFTYITNDNKSTLNLDYYSIYSKNKIASLLFEDDDFEDIDIYNYLSQIIIQRFKNKWDRMYEVLVEAEYDPIENYSMLEVRTPDLTFETERATNDNRTLNLTDGETINTTDTLTLNTTNELTLNTNEFKESRTETDLTTTEAINRFGYNDNGTDGSPYEKKTTAVSGSPVDNSQTDDIDRTGTETTTNTGTETTTHIGTDTTTHTGTDNVAHTGTDTTTHTGTERLERSGNIGVTTSQQMVQSTIDLYSLSNFVNIMFNDIDKVLTQNIFK